MNGMEWNEDSPGVENRWRCAGGASWTVGSVQAGLWGGAAGVPLVALRELIWMPNAHRRFPVLRDVTATYTRNLAPLVKNMTPEQVLHLALFV